MNYIKHIILLIGIIFSITACVDEKDDYLEGYVYTQAASSIDSTSALCGGLVKIKNKGTGVQIKIEENGILCSEDSANLKMHIYSDRRITEAKYFISSQTEEGDFPCQLDNLNPNTHYYVRAYSVIICSYPNDKNESYRNIEYGNIQEFVTRANDVNGNGNDTIPSIPVILFKPDSLTAGIWMNNCILLKWKSVPNAANYEIWRSNNGKKDTYTLIAAGDYNILGYGIYEDCKPLQGDNYYKIKATNGKYESEFSDSVYCDFSLTNIDPCPVEILSITGDASALTIIWDYSTDTRCGTPDKYILKKRNTKGEYEFVAETTSNRYTDTSVHPGLNRYCVAAVNEHSESKCYESMLSPQIPFASVPSGVKACMSGQNVTVSWNTVPWAPGYPIYVSLSSPDDDSSYYLTANGDVEGNVSSWTRELYNNGTVYFKVRAVWFSNYIGGYPEYSALSTNYATVSSAPCTVSNLQASGNSAVTLSWSASSKCECASPTSYSVYKRNPNTGDMDIKKYTNLNTSYTDNSAHPGINEYAVVAVNNKGNSPIDDPLAFVSSEFIPLSTPTNLQCKVAMGNLFRLSWTNVPQATGYRVYISTLPDGTYSPKYKVSTNSNDAVFSYDGTSNPIYVKVQAVWESSYGNSNTIYSDFSNVVSVAFE